MGLLGDILSLPVKIVNTPIKLVEHELGMNDDDDMPKPSEPLSYLASVLKEVDEDD
jgi:hypothetical protein